MSLDNFLQFSDEQTIRTMGSNISTNVLDMIDSHEKFSYCMPTSIFVKVTTTFASGGAGTLACDIQASDEEDFSSGVDTYSLFGATALASLTAGARLNSNEYMPTDIDKRYIRLRFTVGTAAFTAGAVSAGFEPKRITGQKGAVDKTYASSFDGTS